MINARNNKERIKKQTIREKEFLVYVQFKVFEYYRGHKNNNIHGLPQQDF